MTQDRIWVRELGQGPRQALALHCTIAHSGAWRGVAEALGGQATLTCPDMLSHGRSAEWDGQGDFTDLMVDLMGAYVRPELDLIGHSFGAVVALRLAEAYPEQIRSLTLIEPVMFGVARQDAPEVMEAHDRDAKPSTDAMAAGDWPLAARLFNRMWSNSGPRWPDMPQSLRDAMIRGVRIVPGSAASVMWDAPGLLQPGRLARVSMPVLLIRGDQTHPAMTVVNDGLDRRLPHARQVVIPGAGHMAPISHPSDTAAAIRALWEDAKLAA